jgi:hypothetical protein
MKDPRKQGAQDAKAGKDYPDLKTDPRFKDDKKGKLASAYASGFTSQSTQKKR